MKMSSSRSRVDWPNSHRKIEPQHWDRLAVVYIRQSTYAQVVRHQESTRVQYGLTERVVQMGWPAERVLVIDDDLGCSGTTSDGRPGFQRLVAEVGLNHVGMVFGVEMSRLARSCRDWYQLLEVCAVFGTLIGDLDGVYDPRLYNDRLLLGLKGTMSEAELHLIKQRMLEGKKAKAQRGELGVLLPRGYVCQPSGQIAKDSDEQVQETVELVFELFERYGTLNAVLRHFVDNGIQLPCRVNSGPRKGELEWRRPNRNSLSNLLRNPIYAGAYVYGRRPTDPRKKIPGRPSTGRTVAKPEEWEVCLKDKLPAYISWEQYERNLKQLEQNTASAAGVVRNGPSLLSGLIVCGHCGYRMAVQYGSQGNRLRYNCSRISSDYGGPRCQSLAGEPLDKLVADLVLKSLEPAALEISLKVAEDIESERRQVYAQWDKKLERAHYEVERAFRQYNAAEPENRLVVRTLERRWEDALSKEQELKEEYARLVAREPVPLKEEDRERIRKLASDIPVLWHSVTTTPAERQTIVRQLIERIIVTVQGDTEKVDVEIHWAGGHKTNALLVRPVARLEQLSYYEGLSKRVAELHSTGITAKAIAKKINEEGWRPAKRRDTFNGYMVSNILSRMGLTKIIKTETSMASKRQKSDEWTLPELARKLDMSPITLYSWYQKDRLTAHRTKVGSRIRLMIKADETEIERLRSIRNEPRAWALHKRVENVEGF
jgi:DNA invertase Pin-like site-specific DNA recombinase